MASLETLLVDQSDGVATVTLNRPEPKNALSPLMADEPARLCRPTVSNPSEDR